MGIPRLRRQLSLVVATVVSATSLAGVGPASIARAADEVPVPTVTAVPANAPGVHNHALFDSYYDLASFRYEQQEYFVSGEATSDDGATTASYTTRIIVFRPTTASSSFNGTVLLDWTNVTAQFENAVDTMTAREMLMRERFAFVHVSAQSAGVCCTPLTPKVWDPIRYASLNHPGDQYANDMFTQIAQAFRAPSTPLINGTVRHVVAAGQSQSGSKLNDYVVKYLPNHSSAVGIVDGIVVHGAASSGAAKLALANATDGLTGVRVVHLLSDQEAVQDSFDPSAHARYRLWEVAGTAHSDLFIGYQSVVGQGPRTAADTAPVSKAAYDDIIRAAGNYGAEIHPMLATCLVGGATMPMHYAASTVLSQLNRWLNGGAAPNNGPRFAFDPLTGKVATDAFGNTLGGIRMPPIDVPIARYRSTACPLGGVTVPLTDAEIVATYPTFDGYYQQMRDRTLVARDAGWLLPEDATDLLRRACAAQSRWHPLAPLTCAPLPPPA